MKIALSCLLLLAGISSAQPTARLDFDLAALSNPNTSLAVIAARITDDILALSDKDARPSRQTTLDFAVELSKALSGKPLSTRTIEPVSAAILDVLESSGVPSSRFHGSVDRLRGALIALNATPLQARTAAGYLMNLGQEVRGPEDYKFLLLKR